MNKDDKLEFEIISGSKNIWIKQIASWYYEEWSIPEEKTSEMIRNLGPDCFHAILFLNGEPVATGGVHHQVSILGLDPSLARYKNWLAMVFVKPGFRGQSIGSSLCAHLERQAIEHKIEKLHLFTHTAESFYYRRNWKVIKRIHHQDRNIAIMEKLLVG